MSANQHSTIIHLFDNKVIIQTSEDVFFGEHLVPKAYCNATAMCKAHGKRWSNYVRLKSSIDYIEGLSLDAKSIIEIKGTPNGDASLQGTWVHPKIAQELLRWCANTKTVQTEKTIQQKLQNEIGGEREVLTSAGLIDLLTTTELIEVKHVKNWKSGVGQLVLFSIDYPSHKKRLHLFGAVSTSMLHTIKRYCNKLQITVTSELVSFFVNYAMRLIDKFDCEPVKAINEAIEFYR